MDFEKEVMERLGEDRVLLQEDASAVWKTRTILPFTRLHTIPFDIGVFNRCAGENKKGIADWYFVFVHGFSLRAMWEILGTKNFQNNDFFDLASSWWIHRGWSRIAPEAGYYLIDFKPRYGHPKNAQPWTKWLNWAEQEEMLKKDAPNCIRCHEATILEAAITLRKVKGEWLLQEPHLGITADKYNLEPCHIRVEKIKDGLGVWLTSDEDNRVACLYRCWERPA